MGPRITVLYLGPADLFGHVRENLPGQFEVRLGLQDADVDELLPSCDTILDAYMRVRFSADRLQRATKLRLFVTATTGADHIDGAVLARRGIPLLTLRGQAEVLRNITAAAEHSWLLLLACARGLPAAMKEVREGRWDRNNHPGVMLRGKTLGIIGCGRIGEWMSRYGQVFGMQCLGYDPHLESWPKTIEKCDLESVLRNADFLTVHVPLSDETRHILGAKMLNLLKPGAIVVNTSRGEVIDEEALLAALAEGRIAGAGLDVLTGEPDIASHRLVEYARNHANLIITPHIGGFSPDALRYVLAFSCRRITSFFRASDERPH